ncbi:hypothetical protein VUR80DRAFT_8845 [Thermomyces stellatus]
MGTKSFTGVFPFPCPDCIVTSPAGDLEFEDGSSANAHTGMWLHHMHLVSLGREDETCDEDTGLARIWASGNKPSLVDLSNNGTRKAALRISQEIIGHTTELMNESADARDAYPVLGIEHVPSSTPGFYKAIPLYLDVAGYCTDSAVPVPEGKDVFGRSIKWTIAYSGEILGVWEHLHDGRTKQEVELNGEALCEHVTRCGESEEYVTHVGMFDEEPAGGEDV